jgi:ClpP class serine protease
MHAVPVSSLGSGVVAAPRRPFAVTLTPGLLAEHRGGAVVALGEDTLGRAWALRSEAPSAALWRMRGEMPEPVPDVPEPAEAKLAPGSVVAVLDVDGPLSQREVETWCGYVQGYDGIARRLREALDAPEVGAVVLRVDSPGGDVAGLEEAVATMRADVARAGKPVLGYVDELAASAAYWLAAAVCSSGVYLPGSGLVGSIGCLAVHVSEARALDAAGVDVEVVRDPRGKAAGHPAEPFSDVASARLEELVRAASARFARAVSAARPLSATQARALDGAVLEGSRAVEAGLADGVASLADTITRAASMARARPAGMGPVAEAKDAAASRRRKSMDHALVCALAGLAIDATEAQVGERLRALASFEAEAVALSGESEPRRAIGALRAHVERSKKADDIEARAVRAHVEHVLGAALARGTVMPAELDDLRAWGLAPGGADALESYLGKRAPVVSATQTPPPASPDLPAAPAPGEPEKHDGKTYAELSFTERAALEKKNPALFGRMRAAHKAASRKG